MKRVFGFDDFRPNQEGIVLEILQGRDVFAAMPTGGGKSLCYQLPALLLPGLTVVISPLLALMKDQVDAAKESGIAAALLNSAISTAEAAAVYRSLESGSVDLLYISPERFAFSHFAEKLKTYQISLFAVDEAHCLSEWGHDFRPDYLGLSGIKSQFPGVPIAAFTATATEKVQRDIIKALKLQDPHEVRASFNREELNYRIIPKEDTTGQVLRCVKEHDKQAGIVYHTSRASVEKTALLLQKYGFRALPYHAGLDSETRKVHQELFNKDEIEVIVATIAFGMGIDKSNVRYIIHADLPRSVEGYYQETGRAGRDGLPAECLLLFSRGDIMKIKYHIDRMDNAGERGRAERNLEQIITLASVHICRRKQLLDYFGEDYGDTCGNCDVCRGEAESEDATEDAQKILSAVVRTGERFGVAHVIDVVRGADTEKIRNFSHQRLPTWGVGKEKSKISWRRLADELLAQKCLRRDSDRYNALVLTPVGKDVLYGKKQFTAMRYGDPSRADLPIPELSANQHGSAALFQSLRATRKKIAKKRGVPPYVVFSDKTLREMAAVLPDSLPAMLRITGVGERKLDQYGETFLNIILEFVEKNG